MSIEAPNFDAADIDPTPVSIDSPSRPPQFPNDTLGRQAQIIEDYNNDIDLAMTEGDTAKLTELIRRRSLAYQVLQRLQRGDP